MVKFRLYKGGLDEVAMEFTEPEELKNHPEIKWRLFDKNGEMHKLSACGLPSYDRTLDYYHVILKSNYGVEGHLISQDPEEIKEMLKKMNVEIK